MRTLAALRACLSCAVCLLAVDNGFGIGEDTTVRGGPAAALPGSAPAVAAVVAVKPDLSIPTDSATQWQVGFTVFSAESLSPENEYLAYSLPLLLRNELLGLDSHASDDAERMRAQARILSRAVREAEKALTATRRERDALDFNDTTPTAAIVRAAEAKSSAAAARRDFLRAMDPAQISVADAKPVVYKDGDAEGKLFPVPTVPRAVFAEAQNLDLVVGGSLKEVLGYLVVDVWAYDPLRDALVFTTREAAPRDDLYGYTAGLGLEIASAILGRDWSRVAFVPSPATSSLVVDGVLAATGAAPSLYLAPGTHEITVAAPGFRAITRTVSLASRGDARLEDILDPVRSGSLAINSDPPGASLYVDSILQGTTPLTVALPPVRSRGVLVLDGFYDSSFSLDAGSATPLSFSLQPDQGDRTRIQKKARDDFYATFGFFALSIPLPLFSYALSFDYSVQHADFLAQGLTARAAGAETASYVFLGTYYTGIAISVAVFAWMVSRIITYVTVSNGTAG